MVSGVPPKQELLLLRLVCPASSIPWGSARTHGTKECKEGGLCEPHSLVLLQEKGAPLEFTLPCSGRRYRPPVRTGLPHCSASTEHTTSRGPEGHRTEEHRFKVDPWGPHPQSRLVVPLQPKAHVCLQQTYREGPGGRQSDLGVVRAAQESSRPRKAKGFAIPMLNYSCDPLSLPDASRAGRNAAMGV